MTNDAVISTEGRSLLRQESLSFPELLSRYNTTVQKKTGGVPRPEIKEANKSIDPFGEECSFLNEKWIVEKRHGWTSANKGDILKGHHVPVQIENIFFPKRQLNERAGVGSVSTRWSAFPKKGHAEKC